MPYTCTWSHNSTAITMVKKPVLNQEWDFSLGAEKSLNEGTCRQGWGASKEKQSTPMEASRHSTYCLTRHCVSPAVGALRLPKGKGAMETP